MPSIVQSLTLPHATIATLSPSPYLTAHLVSRPSRRANGRTTDTFRLVTCHTGSLTHCAGSAVVRVGDTAVVCGVQAEILLAANIPNPDSVASSPISSSRHGKRGREGEVARLGLVVPNVELATGCSPAHLPGAGGPPGQVVQTLTSRLYSLLLSSNLVDAADLRITRTAKEDDEEREEVIGYWTLYLSIHVMSLSGESSLFDAAWGCLVAALKDVKLPKAQWNDDAQGIVCSDAISDAAPLHLRGLPVAATWGVFRAGPQEVQAATAENNSDGQATGVQLQDGSQSWLLADPDDFESQLCKETFTVVVDCTNSQAHSDVRILTVEKSGGSTVELSDIDRLVPLAAKRWADWRKVLIS